MDLVITILALLATIYAVVPRERQLDLRVRVSIFDRILVIVAFLIVLYLEFNEFFSERGWTFHRPWPVGITPRHAVYLVMVVVTLILWGRMSFSRLTPSKVVEFRTLVEQLYWSESYSELLTLFEKHLKELFKIQNSRFLLSRVRRHFLSLSGSQIDDLDERIRRFLDPARPTPPSKNKQSVWQRLRSLSLLVFRPFAPGIAQILPNDRKAKEAAGDIVRGILLSPRFVAPLVKTRPYFGLEIVKEAGRSQQGFEFADVYLTELIRNAQSVLYAELQNNQNCGPHRYFLTQSNRLLYFFLSDIKVAQEYGVYKPIGDFCVGHLREVGRDHESDSYNLAMSEDFENEGAWRSPLFVVIRFFDIMVKEGLFQGIEWHMWLYYYPSFAEKIVENYRIADAAADPTNEWPIRYSFLLYEMFTNMSDWVLGLKEVPRDQKNVVLRSTKTDHENGNIPKSSILALGQCSRSVLESDFIDDKFKRYLLDIVFRLFFDLKQTSGLERYATALATALSVGGFYKPRSDSKYDEALLDAFTAERDEYFIKHSYEHVEELEAALRR